MPQAITTPSTASKLFKPNLENPFQHSIQSQSCYEFYEDSDEYEPEDLIFDIQGFDIIENNTTANSDKDLEREIRNARNQKSFLSTVGLTSSSLTNIDKTVFITPPRRVVHKRASFAFSNEGQKNDAFISRKAEYPAFSSQRGIKERSFIPSYFKSILTAAINPIKPIKKEVKELLNEVSSGTTGKNDLMKVGVIPLTQKSSSGRRTTRSLVDDMHENGGYCYNFLSGCQWYRI